MYGQVHFTKSERNNCILYLDGLYIYLGALGKEIGRMDSRMLWGMVDMLILDVVSRGPTYGYQIAQTVMSQSKGYFELKEGSL